MCKMNTVSGAMTLVDVRSGVVNPSYLTISHNNRFLYSVSEISGHDEQGRGLVISFSINDQTHELKFLNSQPSHGSSPCHLTIDKNDRYVLVSNYGSGSLAVLPVMPDGRLGVAAEVVRHARSIIDLVRQRNPHVHSSALDADNHFAVVADLGLNKLLVYRFDEKSGTLRPVENSCVRAAAGAGPRQLAFAPNGRRAFVTNELNSTLAVFDYDPRTGQLKESQVLSTLPAASGGVNICADVQVHPSGSFVYASNRGYDSIAVFRVDKDRGSLRVVQHQSSLGKTPRGMAIDPTGRFLLVANQDSDSIAVFAVDVETGTLSVTTYALKIPTPACACFSPRPLQEVSET